MKLISETRKNVANLVKANENEVIFTSGTTDSLNKIALMLKKTLKKDDEILISPTNHASSIVPFIEIAKKTGAKIVSNLNLIKSINKKTKIIVFAQQDNGLDNFVNVEELYKKAKKNNVIVINDAAQAIAHQEVKINYSDVIIFSGNKLYGPTGIGTLIIKEKLLSKLEPSTFGGGATSMITNSTWESKGFIGDFEAGTPNTAGIIGLNEAIIFFNKNKKELWLNENKLADYAYDKLMTIEGIKIYSKKGDTNILFNVKDYNAQDITSYLGHKNILIRSGGHCAHMLNEVISSFSTNRVSICGYNNNNDIDILVEEIKNGGDFLEFL